MRQDAEFKAMLGALSPSELNALRESIEVDGVREPILLWSQYQCPECGDVVEIHQTLQCNVDGVWYCSNCGHELEDEEYQSAVDSGVIVDGYNRAEIAKQLEIDVPVRFVIFESRTDAKKWIARNQLGRRNIGPDKASYCRGLLYNDAKHDVGRPEKCGHFVHINGRTGEAIAADFGVNEKTIRRDGQFAEAVDALESAIPGTIENALSGQVPKAKIIEAAKQAKSGDFTAAKSTITKEESDKRIKKMREDMERSIEEKRKQDLERMPVYKRAASLLEGAGSLEYAIRALIKEIPEENRLAVITEAIKALRNESILMQRRQ
jgi:ribosomal protein L37AE/L43A